MPLWQAERVYRNGDVPGLRPQAVRLLPTAVNRAPLPPPQHPATAAEAAQDAVEQPVKAGKKRTPTPPPPRQPSPGKCGRALALVARYYRTMPGDPPPPPDVTAPYLSITLPDLTIQSTPNDSIYIAGDARDPGGIAQVVWSAETGSHHDAGGTCAIDAVAAAAGSTRWSATVPLLVGDNRITIQATDLAGNAAERHILIVRTAPPPSPPPQ